MLHPKNLILTLTILIFSGLMALSIASAHEGEENEEEQAGVGATSDSTVSDSANIVMDSVYASINTGFEQLHYIFKKGCFDCHTDRTVYPWYYKLPIIHGIIDNDVRGAKRHVDMSNGFPFGGHHRPADQLAGIREELKDDDMPPELYRLGHWSATPNAAERDSIYAWVDSSLSLLAAHGIKPTPEEHDMDED
jgi:hypothetical protein